nr:MAG: hypothetical protein 1 [Luteoviridae sp.]
MANELRLPENVWQKIWGFLYQDVEVEMDRASSLDTWRRFVNAERGRRIRTALGMSLQPAIYDRALENDLIMRGQLVQYAGVVDHSIARDASLYEMLLRLRMDHLQTFPALIEFDGDLFEINPDFRPIEAVNQVLQPAPELWVMEANRNGWATGNPWLFRYLIRPLGDEVKVRDLPEEDFEAVRAKRRSVIQIKALYFFWLLSMSLIPNALAEDVCVLGDEPQEREVAPSKYWKLWSIVLVWLMHVITFVTDAAAWVGTRANLDWYVALADEVQAVVDVVLAVAVLVMVYLIVRRKPMNLIAATKDKKANRFLGQVLGEKGMVYRVRVNGTEYELTATEETGVHEDEMAMPGSEFFPCRAQPVGAILVATNETDVKLFGMFWRMDDFLVTARHCSNTLNQSTARVYLAKTAKTKRGNYEIDKTNLYRAPEDFFSPENNIIASYDIDAFACIVEPKVWSQIGLTKASTRVRSAYGQQVHSVGFSNDGLLVSASGKTLKDSGHELLYHSASTQKGFSGSVILCGNSVIGMHVSAAGDHNVAVRVELIQYLIDVASSQESKGPKYTYANASYKDHYRQHKWRGGVGQLKIVRDGSYSIVLDNGEATYGWDMKSLAECFGPYGDYRKDEDYFQDLLFQTNFKTQRERYVSFDDDDYDRRAAYENVEISSVATSAVRGDKRKKKTKRTVSKPELPYTVESGLKPIHGPSAPKMQPEAVQVIENHKEEIVALGYEEGIFAYPEMTPETERKSLVEHLKLFAQRVRSVKRAPVADEMRRCAAIVAEMMKAASYVPDVDYDKESGIIDVINSSIIQPEKASGYPYCECGQVINKQVLAAYGVKGFAQLVLNKWNDLVVIIKVFLKGEPTKKKKLDRGMPRCICGLPVDVTVKHASVFRRLTIQLVKVWKQTPVKYAFAPANPGHIEHLASVLPGQVWESDKSNWDYAMLQWIADVTRDVVKLLALRHPDWTEEQHKKYLQDVEQCFDQVFKHAKYRTSDGHLFTTKDTGIMKSGWFMTIAANSIAQVVVHVMTCIRLGMTDDEILALAIVAGGDDVNQEPVPAGRDAYIAQAADLGVEMEIHERESLFHSEYFSSDLRMGPDGPTFHPKRWTKHIEHLKTVKLEFLGDALCSHMENYRHEPAKFRLLENMYHELRTSHPNEFPLSRLVSRDLLLARQYGYEHALC